MQVNARLQGTAIATVRGHFPTFSRHFALSASKMAAKTTSGSGFDLKFRLNAPSFLLESEFVAAYLHALSHFSPYALAISEV